MATTESIEIPITGDYASFRAASDAAIKQMQKMTDEEKKWANFSAEQTKRAQSYAAVERQKAQALAESNTQVNKQKFSFTELNSAINIAGQAVRYLKQGYDFAKEGAQLEMVEFRFDRLAKSIGTTSDALMDDLSTATRGLYSDAELMASATDFMALGLANSHDEAVRLASVSAGLNMNMNQLVLTLTNMTTMRFDALGVRVDGFKEKVKALEEQGYSTDAAFKEAFLQQAEQQLLTVGHAADTTAGAFMAFEAHFKNSMDIVKRDSAEALAPLLIWITETDKKTMEFGETLRIVNKDLYAQYQVMHQATPEMIKLVEQYNRAALYDSDWKDSIYKTNDALSDQSEAIQNVALSTEELAKIEKEMQKDRKGLVDLSISLTDQNKKHNEAQQEIKDKTLELLAEKEKLLQQGYWKESEAILKINQQINDLSDKYDDNSIAFEEATNRKIAMMTIEKIAMMDGVAGYSAAEAEKANAVLNTLGIVEDSALRQAIAFDQVTTAMAAGQLKAQELDTALRLMERGYTIDAVLNVISNLTYGHEQTSSPKGPLSGGYSQGGISTGPQSGHWELLHGTEAVIPLQNGSIPVQVQSGGTSSGGGGTSSGGGFDMSMLNLLAERFADAVARSNRAMFEKSGRR